MIRAQLLHHEAGMVILTVGHEPAPPLKTPDPAILQWIEQEGFILVSRNRRTMPRHLRDHLAAGGHIPGIMLLRRHASLG